MLSGVKHFKKCNLSPPTSPTIKYRRVSTFMNKKDFNSDKMAPLAEIRLAEFLAKHNLHVAAADYFILLICIVFFDFRIAQAFSEQETMQTLFFSWNWDKCYKQKLQKVNPVEERISYINNCKIVTPFFGIYFSTLAAAIGIFQAIESAKFINEIPCQNCITGGIDNTTVIIGWHNSLFGKLIKRQNCNLMGCSWWFL